MDKFPGIGLFYRVQVIQVLHFGFITVTEIGNELADMIESLELD